MVVIAELWTFWPSCTWTNVSNAVPVVYEWIDGIRGKESVPVDKLVGALIFVQSSEYRKKIPAINIISNNLQI